MATYEICREKKQSKMTPKSQAQATRRLMAPLMQRNRYDDNNEISLKHPEFEVYMNKPMGSIASHDLTLPKN